MKDLLDTYEAADYLGISPFTLTKSRSNKRLLGRTPPEHIRLGYKTVRYNKESLDEWLDAILKKENVFDDA